MRTMDEYMLTDLWCPLHGFLPADASLRCCEALRRVHGQQARPAGADLSGVTEALEEQLRRATMYPLVDGFEKHEEEKMTDEEMDRICDEALRAWLNGPTCGENFVCPIFLAFSDGEVSDDSYQRHGARKNGEVEPATQRIGATVQRGAAGWIRGPK